MHCVMLYDLWRGSHVNSDAAQRIAFHNLRVEADSPYWIQTDGEARGVRLKLLRSVFNPMH